MLPNMSATIRLALAFSISDGGRIATAVLVNLWVSFKYEIEILVSVSLVLRRLLAGQQEAAPYAHVPVESETSGIASVWQIVAAFSRLPLFMPIGMGGHLLQRPVVGQFERMSFHKRWNTGLVEPRSALRPRTNPLRGIGAVVEL
jgi:hypothetical protein